MNKQTIISTPKDQLKAINLLRDEIDLLKKINNDTELQKANVSEVFYLQLFPEKIEQSDLIKKDGFMLDLHQPILADEKRIIMEQMIERREKAIQVLINSMEVKGYQIL